MQFSNPPTFTIYGGSFNPVHEGHLAIVDALLRQPDTHQVLVIPAHRSPFKQREPPLPADLRWAMLRRALGDRRRVCLLDVELRRPPPSYTYETLQVLAAMLPLARFRLALGWDVFRDFAHWRQAARILEETELLVFGRSGVDGSQIEDVSALAAMLPARWHDRVRPSGTGCLVRDDGKPVLRYLNLDLPDVSASQVLRERLLERVPAGARELLADYWRQASGRVMRP